MNWGKRKQDLENAPEFVKWESRIINGYSKGDWTVIQLKKFVKFLPEGTGVNVVTWLNHHEPNPIHF